MTYIISHFPDLDIDGIDEAPQSSTAEQNGPTTQAASSSDHMNDLDSLLSYNLVPEGRFAQSIAFGGMRNLQTSYIAVL